MSSILPVTDGLVLELHPGTDAPTTLLNHATGLTTASVYGAPTYGVGYVDLNGNAATPKGVDTGYQAMADNLTFMALIDPNTAASIMTSSGTNTPLRAIGRLIFDTAGIAGETFTINGQTVTLRAAGAAGFEINIGATPQISAAAAAALINANPGVFGVTPYLPAGNSVINLTAVTAGTAANTLAMTEASASMRVTNCGYTSSAPPQLLSGGTAGEVVVTGLDHSGTNFRFHSSSLGTGGIPLIPVPAAAGYHYLVGRGGLRDFPELLLFGADGLAARAVGTTAGRAIRAAANVVAGLAGGGTGNLKAGFLAIAERIIGDDELLAGYVAAVKPYGLSKGLAVN